MAARKVTTQRGIECSVHEWGDGKPLLYLHGAGGLLPQEPLLERLGKRFHVIAPEWPGYGEETTEDILEDMLDFTLHGWDLVHALDLEEAPYVVGHSMGGMIAAEMAATVPQGIERLVLIGAAGLWIEEAPIPDIFAMVPFELAEVLFADPQAGEQILTGGVDFNDFAALQEFLVVNSRRLGTAGKILFPIPNRRVSKRLYRVTADTLLVWGKEDRLIPPLYAERWKELLPKAEIALIEGAGHMVPYEQTAAVATALEGFLN